jgi:UDP-glucose:(heptosyl)LPS alpha-1,3-glucosyltransferase
MRVALSFPACHRRGGVERILVECANFLSRRGHDVSVLSAEFDAGVLDAAIRQELIPVRAKGAVARLNEYQTMATERLERLQAAGPIAHGSFGVVCPFGGVLWVQSVHAEWLKLSRASRGFVGRLKQRLNPFHPYILGLERDVYRQRRYRRLIALTPRVRDEIIEHYGVAADDIDLLPNGYNHDEFNPAARAARRADVRAKLGYTDTDRVLVFVANELERKGFFPLLDALAALNNPAVKLLVVGRVSVDQALIARLGLAGRVHATGPSADVAMYYAAADLFVLPTYYEAWGLVIVEALACGLPVLTSRLAGAAVAVDEGRTGLLLTNPRDAAEIRQKLEHLLTPPLVPPEAISASVEQYQWRTLLQQYEAILTRIM